MKPIALIFSFLLCLPAVAVTSDCKELSWIVMYDDEVVTKEALLTSLKVIGGAYNLKGVVAGSLLTWVVIDHQAGVYNSEQEDQEVLDHALTTLAGLPGVSVSCNGTVTPAAL